MLTRLTSLQHPLVKHLVKLRSDPDYRSENKLVVIEGSNFIKEVVPYITKLVCNESAADLAQYDVPEKIIVTDQMMSKISGMTSPEGMIAEVKMPPWGNPKKWDSILVLDRINDPGNLGTLLRTALAFDWSGVYLLPDCCDPYNEKTLRAGRGAQFKIPLFKGSAEDLQKLVNEEGIQAWVADLKGADPGSINETKKRLLVLGNEAQGPSPLIKDFCQPITIPMTGEMESLNVAVAGGILLYLLKTKTT